MSEIKDIIREYRKKNNMTQKELADRSNISLRALSNYENGSRIPPLEMLIKISNVLDIPLDELSYILLDSIDIYDDLNEVKKMLTIQKGSTAREKMLVNHLLNKINHIQITGGYQGTDIEIILNELSSLSKSKVEPIDILKYYITSKNYDITKFNDDILNYIDKRFSEILELEFYKLNK